MPDRKSRLREYPNGLLVAVRRGSPPDCPDGYIRDSHDPYVFRPIIEDCEYRSTKKIRTRCCIVDKLYCTKQKDFIEKRDCKKCQTTK